MYAVYALCRLADDIVDDQDGRTAATPADGGRPAGGFADRFRTALAERTQRRTR